MAANDDGTRKKERDPILVIGFVVLILAFAVVGGVFINDQYLADDSGSPAQSGSVVNVNYTGSYYGYHAESGAAVFDTSLWSVADSADFMKSYEFVLGSQSSYTPISFTIGNGSYLSDFEKTVIGLKPGQSGTVCIAPKDGYGALTADDIVELDSTVTDVPVTQIISYDAFKKNYNGGIDITGNTTILGPYGWNINVVYTQGNPAVIMTHMVTAGQTYQMDDNVSVEVQTVTDTFGYTYRISFEAVPSNTNTTDGSDTAIFVDPTDSSKLWNNIKLIKIFYEGTQHYITAVDNAALPTAFLLKNTDEKTGMYLYFDITFVDYDD